MTEQTSRLAIIIDSSGAQKNAENLSGALGGLTEWGRKAAESAKKVTKATEDEKNALYELLDRIDPVNAALNKLDKQQQELAKFKARGFLDDEAFELYSKKIETTRGRLSGFSGDMDRATISAGQYKQALRQLPMQLNDVAVSLAGGMPLFTVFMQQGSQIADSFGGWGSLFDIIKEKLLGAGDAAEDSSDSLSDNANSLSENAENAKKLTGFLNPMTIGIGAVVAVVGALTYAWYKGNKEQQEYNKALIMTGNIAGTTSGQLADMASRIATDTGNPISDVASVLTSVVSSGKIAAGSMETVTHAIVAMTDASDVAADSMVADFEKISANPSAAITELNDKYHFLTSSVYEQIRALQEQGNTQDAARIATDTYSAAVEEMAGKLSDNLGALESAWKALGDSAKDAWNSMLDIGREKTLSQRLDEAKKLVNSSSAGYTRDVWGNVVGLSRDAKADVNILTGVINLQGDLNSARAKGQKIQDDGIAAMQQINSMEERYASNAEKRAKAQQKYTDQLIKARASGIVITPERESQARKNIDDQFKDPKPAATRQAQSYSEDAATRLLDQINQQTAALDVQLNAADKLSSVTQERLKFEQQIHDIQSRVDSHQQVTKDQLSLLSRQKEIEQAYLAQEALQKQVTTLDDYRSMQEQVRSKEQQQNDLLSDRLKLLEKAKAAGAQDTEKTRADIYKNTPVTMPSSVNSAIGSLQPTDGRLAGTFAGLSAQYGGLDKAQEDLKAWLQAQEDAYTRAGDITQAGEDRMSKIRQDAAIANQRIEAQKTEIISSATQSMMDSTVSIMQDGFGKQSAAYKVAFAASKAYAIADSLVKIQQAIASGAVSAPYPANLIAMASIAAQTASIVSSISSVSANGFQSGGYTGNGGVSSVAGVVHGQEYVFDAAATRKIGVTNLESIRKNGLDATLSKPGMGTGAKNISGVGLQTQSNHISQTINMPANAGLSSEEMSAALNRSNRQLIKDLKSQTLSGNGEFGTALRAAQGRGNRMT